MIPVSCVILKKQECQSKTAISPALPASAVICSSLTAKTTSEKPESTWHTYQLLPFPSDEPSRQKVHKIHAFIKGGHREHEKVRQIVQHRG